MSKVIKKSKWIEELKRLLKEQYKFTDKGIEGTDFQSYIDAYYIQGYSPEEVLKEDFCIDPD